MLKRSVTLKRDVIWAYGGCGVTVVLLPRTLSAILVNTQPKQLRVNSVSKDIYVYVERRRERNRSGKYSCRAEGRYRIRAIVS